MTHELFETQRLNIRHLCQSDIEDFHDMQSNPNVMRYIKNTMTLEESKMELNRFIGYYDDEKIFFKIWAVVEMETNEMVGICGVYRNDHSEYEIAYRLRESFWGKGYGKEIAKGLIRFCFEEIKLEELTAYVIFGNAGSIRILEKEMEFVKEFYSEKTKCTEQVYQLKRESYIL